MPDFLSIPGNIRQQYMPFTISGPGKKQLFSFKNSTIDRMSNAALIHPFSRHLKTLIENDSSIGYTHRPLGDSKITYEEFLMNIPSIQIREYVPDAKLTQTFKWFSYFKKGFDAGLRNIDSKTYSLTDIKTEMEKVMEGVKNTMKDLTSGAAPLLAFVVGELSHYFQDGKFNVGADAGYAVLYLPFILYYRLTTTHTNNVYEIPYSMQNEIMKSDGTYGWSGSNQSDFGLLDKMGKSVAESPIAKLLLGNTVKVNMMPSFQPTGEAPGTSFSISIDLINDSAEAAANNFLLCHTLFGNNRWLQYGFVQAGSSLYDVKLPGANRYFMCSGAFSCKGKGAFRTPSKDVCRKIIGFAHQNDVTTTANMLTGDSIRDAMIESRKHSILERLDNTNKSSKKDFLPGLDPGQAQADIWTKMQAENSKSVWTGAYDQTASAAPDIIVSSEYNKIVSSVKDGQPLTESKIEELIKIPDVYSLTLTFNTLLPDNFNNYLFGYRAQNLDPIWNYAWGDVDETGAFEKLVQNLQNAIGG